MEIIVIGTWIMAFGTWAMAAALIYQTIMTRKQLEITVKEKERPIIVEFLGRIALPLGTKLDGELDAIKKKEFDWDHGEMKSRRITMIDLPLIQLYTYKFPWIHVMAVYYNSTVSMLMNSLKKVDESIHTPNFGEECRKLVRKFNIESPENSRVPQNEIPDALRRIIRYVINNEKELPETSPYYHFWKKYGTHFLKIRERDEIAIELKAIHKVLDMVIPEVQIFNKKLLKLTEKLMREYHITAEELRELFKPEE